MEKVQSLKLKVPCSAFNVPRMPHTQAISKKMSKNLIRLGVDRDKVV